MKVAILYNTFEGYEEYPGANIEAAALQKKTPKKKPKKKKKTDMEAIADALRELGHEPTIEAAEHTPDGLVQALIALGQR